MIAFRKYSFRLTGRLCLPVAVVLCFYGCIFKEYDDCPNGIYIRLTAVNPKHSMPAVTETVDIYMYDSDGQLTREFNLDRHQLLQSGDVVHIPDFPYGRYRIVAAVNQKDVFIPSGKESYTTLRTEPDHSGSYTALPLLFSGEVEFGYDLGSVGTPEFPLLLTKHNNQFLIDVGMGISWNVNEKVSARIEADNSLFGFAARGIVPSRAVTYLPEKATGPGENNSFSFDITTLWLSTAADVRLIVEKEDGTRGSLELDLIATLAKIRDQAGEYLYDTDDKLAFEDRFAISISLSEDFVITKITINGWTLVEGSTGV